jgi:hypothetical protein
MLTSISYENPFLNSVKIYPNPINESSVLKFELPNEMKVNAKIIDIQGRIVSELIPIDTLIQNGLFQLEANKLNSGLYFVLFSANEFSKTISFIVK